MTHLPVKLGFVVERNGDNSYRHQKYRPDEQSGQEIVDNHNFRLQLIHKGAELPVNIPVRGVSFQQKRPYPGRSQPTAQPAEDFHEFGGWADWSIKDWMMLNTQGVEEFWLAFVRTLDSRYVHFEAFTRCQPLEVIPADNRAPVVLLCERDGGKIQDFDCWSGFEVDGPPNPLERVFW